MSIPITTGIDYGKSFKIEEDGRISFVDGDLKFIEGPDNVGQRLVIALTSQFGEDQFNPSYGLDRFAIFGSELGFDEQVEVLKLQMIRTIMEDDQVVNVPEIEYEASDYLKRLYEFVIKVEIVGGESFIIDLGGIQI